MVCSFLSRQPNPNNIKDFFSVGFGLDTLSEGGSGLVMEKSDMLKILQYLSLLRIKKDCKKEDGHYSEIDFNTELLRLEVLKSGKNKFMSDCFEYIW